MDYTLAQIRGYQKAIAKAQTERDKTLLLLMRSAQLSGEGLQKVWEKL